MNPSFSKPYRKLAQIPWSVVEGLVQYQFMIGERTGKKLPLTVCVPVCFIPAKKPQKQKQAVARKRPRQPWTTEEETELKLLFRKSYDTDRTPGQREIEKQMKISKRQGGLIHMRKRDNIKKKISTMLVKERKRRGERGSRKNS